MSKKVLLVGHCGPDSAYLRNNIKSAIKNVTVLAADDHASLGDALKHGVDLVLLNRELGYGFDEQTGVSVVRNLKASHPQVKTMVVSNYPETQSAAVAAGALPGFGKRELNTHRVTALLRDAVGEPVDSARSA